MKALLVFLLAAGIVAGALFAIPKECTTCHGDGKVEAATQQVRCTSCRGKGTRKSMSGKGSVKSLGGNQMQCLKCRGSGKTTRILSEGGDCRRCGMTGRVSLYEHLKTESE